MLPPPFLPAICMCRVGDDTDPAIPFADVKSPKSCEFPVVAMVKNCIVLVYAGLAPPENTPLIEFPSPSGLVAKTESPTSCPFP